MTIINIMDELHERVGKFIKKDKKLKYPSTKNFVDKAIKEKLDREDKKK